MPSSEPALGLHIAPQAAASLLSLLVLTASSLERWQVGRHQKPFAQCTHCISPSQCHSTSDLHALGRYVRWRSALLCVSESGKSAEHASIAYCCHRCLRKDSHAFFHPTTCKRS